MEKRCGSDDALSPNKYVCSPEQESLISSMNSVGVANMSGIMSDHSIFIESYK